MAKRSTPRGNRVPKGLSSLLRPVTTTHVEVRHDDWCRIFLTGRFADCNCDPDVVPVRPVVALKKGGRS